MLFVSICVMVVSNTYSVVFLLVFVLCTLCCQFLWIVHIWLPLWYSLTFNDFPYAIKNIHQYPYSNSLNNSKFEHYVDRIFSNWLEIRGDLWNSYVSFIYWPIPSNWQWGVVGNETIRHYELSSYVAPFKQDLHIEYISCSWDVISKFVFPINISLT